MEKIKRFFKDEEGVTAIEYGLIAAAMAVVIVGAMTILGPKITSTFQYISDNLH